MQLKGNLFILCGPSGSGKDTLLKEILRFQSDLTQIPTATTRSQRPDEIEGIHHYFLSDEGFESLINEGAFIEWKTIFGYKYGTLKATIEEKISSKHKYIMQIDILGAIEIKQIFPENVKLLFIRPSSVKTLEKRIRKRGSESDQEISVRLSRVQMELSLASKCDFVIINDDLHTAVDRLRAIIGERYISMVAV